MRMMNPKPSTLTLCWQLLHRKGALQETQKTMGFRVWGLGTLGPKSLIVWWAVHVVFSQIAPAYSIIGAGSSPYFP